MFNSTKFKWWLDHESEHGCTGLEIAGVVAALAGTGMQVEGSQESKSAENDVVSQQLAQQAAYQKQGQGVFEQSLAQSTPQVAQKQMQQGTQNALGEYNKLQAVPMTASSAALPSSTTPGAQRANTASQALISNSQQAAAPLQGYNEYALQQRLKDLSANSQLGQISDFSRASASTMPAQMQDAQSEGQGLSGLGSLLGTVGGLMGLYGAISAPATAAATTMSPDVLSQLAGPSYGMTSAQLGQQLGSPLFTAGFSGSSPALWPYLNYY